MDFYIINYTNSAKELPIEVLLSSINAVAKPTGKLAAYLHEDNRLLHFSNLAISYAFELKNRGFTEPTCRSNLTKLVANVEYLTAKKLPSVPLIDLPLLSWRTDSLVTHKKHYIIACRQKLLEKKHLGQTFSWGGVTPPEWFTNEKPLLKLGLGEITVKD